MMNVPFLSWKALTLGKLTDMLSLVTRVEGTEDYCIFNADRMEEAKGLFVWACGCKLQYHIIVGIIQKWPPEKMGSDLPWRRSLVSPTSEHSSKDSASPKRIGRRTSSSSIT